MSSSPERWTCGCPAGRPCQAGSAALLRPCHWSWPWSLAWRQPGPEKAGPCRQWTAAPSSWSPPWLAGGRSSSRHKWRTRGAAGGRGLRRGAWEGQVNARPHSALRVQATPPLEVGEEGGGEGGGRNGRYCGMLPREYC